MLLMLKVASFNKSLSVVHLLSHVSLLRRRLRYPPGVLLQLKLHRIIEGALMSILSNRLWLEIIGLALGVSLLESAVTGKMRKPRSHRYWPVPLRLRPIFGVVGFGLTAYGLVDFFQRFKL
jgi:hypothetical protein